jgi:hypothetical protein
MKRFFRPTALAFACAALALVCAGVSIKHAAAQSVHIEELVDERGPSSKLELTPAQPSLPAPSCVTFEWHQNTDDRKGSIEAGKLDSCQKFAFLRNAVTFKV